MAWLWRTVSVFARAFKLPLAAAACRKQSRMQWESNVSK